MRATKKRREKCRIPERILFEAWKRGVQLLRKAKEQSGEYHHRWLPIVRLWRECKPQRIAMKEAAEVLCDYFNRKSPRKGGTRR